MTQVEKLRQAFFALPSTFRFSEFEKVMRSYGFERDDKGKTSGSRVRFYRESDGRMMIMHSPHPGDEMSAGAIKNAVKFLKEIDGGR